MYQETVIGSPFCLGHSSIDVNQQYFNNTTTNKVIEEYQTIIGDPFTIGHRTCDVYIKNNNLKG